MWKVFCFAAVLCATQTPISQKAEWRPIKSISVVAWSSVLGLAWKNWIRHFAIRPPILTRGEKEQNLSLIFDRSHLQVATEQHVGGQFNAEPWPKQYLWVQGEVGQALRESKEQDRGSEKYALRHSSRHVS